MSKTLVVIFIIVSFFCKEASGQLQQPGRIEIALGEEDEDFDVVPAGDRGILLYRQVTNRETRMELKYQVILVDTTLHIAWENHYYINLRYILRGYEYFGNYFYLLFQRNTENLKADLFVVRIDLNTQIAETFLIEREYAMELTEFEVIGNTLLFGGNSNNLPTIVCYEFGRSQPKVLPGFYEDRTQIQHLEINDRLRTFNVLTNFRTNDGSRSLSLKSFDEAGEIIKNISLQPSEERSLLFGRTMPLDRQTDLIVGTYARKRSDMSRGIFIARVSQDGEQVINYYNYADLKNFFSYMKARRQRKIEERISRRKIKGKKNKFNYRLLVHDVVEHDGRYIMVGEAFYPKYTQASYYNAYGSNYYGNTNYFDGYKYTHAVVFGFDRRGRLVWDNSFEINDVVSYNLDQYVHISGKGDELALVYIYENEIRTKIIEGNEVLEGKTFNELKLSFEDDMVNNNESDYGGLEKWYDGNLFVYGVQKIKNERDEGVRLSRTVFFINKLRYR
ncbi:MAG: hypothetical protein HC819_19085 [Cyclobacteriaceae bacterium]|nr:hypothetical protein [Cyclobacteriaceae bacterium]